MASNIYQHVGDLVIFWGSLIPDNFRWKYLLVWMSDDKWINSKWREIIIFTQPYFFISMMIHKQHETSFTSDNNYVLRMHRHFFLNYIDLTAGTIHDNWFSENRKPFPHRHCLMTTLMIAYCMDRQMIWSSPSTSNCSSIIAVMIIQEKRIDTGITLAFCISGRWTE